MARGCPKSSTAMSGKDRMKKLRAKHGTDKGLDAARKRRANACLRLLTRDLTFHSITFSRLNDQQYNHDCHSKISLI